MEEYPTGILSVVSDSYDIFNACSEIIGTQLREEVKKRDGVLVVRPDSGDPVATVLKVLEILGEKIGKYQNRKGYQVLDPHVRVLWGDGLDYDTIYDILLAMRGRGWSAVNIATFGMGGGLLQKINRDTQRFAFKCSAQCRNGVWHDIFKEPLDKTKVSKKGKLALRWNEGAHGKFLETVPEDGGDDLLDTVFEDGELKRDMSFDEVRKNAEL